VVLLLDLLALRFDVELMLELCTVCTDVWSAVDAEVKRYIVAALTDGTMAFGTGMKVGTDLLPCQLERVSLFFMPL
jgi:hypothetical protein